ncbi:hypothetical protein WQ57_05460 [Mesobacillus campisalis]|uniref:RelA/SpoT domain-containing protein n=1 Tax=Mesobacillus campisalis TaxID=1408103 RepID=A0A0M2T319_9BACI|nr:hypothetical protein [Mesobacillus campisalis]KKK39210.1 hypothetical protein WQ57_05460 [Mesobacillus campisalis]
MEQLTEFIRCSKEELDKKRDSLEEINKNILNFLDTYFIKDKKINNVMVQGRVKGTSSLSEKIIRKRYADRYKSDHEKFIDELPDLIGIRLVCLLVDQEIEVFESIQSTFTESVGDGFYSIPELLGSKNNLVINYHNQPEEQKNKKKIYRMSCRWIGEEQEIPVELQIKSLINMFWGEIEHMLFYKNYTYMIGSDFYTNIMDSIFKNLVAIDAQLKQMSHQLSQKSKEEQFQEMKQMFAKLMYNMFYENFREELIDIELDFREVYDLMVQIEFKDVTTIGRAQNTMTKLINTVYDRSEFTSSLFAFENYDLNSTILREERKELGVVLGQLSQSNDVYWIALIGLYRLLNNKQSITEVIDCLANDLMSFYSRFDSIFDPEDEAAIGKPLYKRGIELGIVNAFSNYKKLDFFIIEVYQSKIFVTLHDFLKGIKEPFLSLTQSEIEKNGEIKILNVIKGATSLKVMSVIEKKIGIEYLKQIYTLIEDTEMSGLIFNMQKFKELLDNQRDLVTEELIQLFINSREEGENYE